jgi:ubiquinone/menaquinone biosynthesis C-methylase UbiE
MPQLSPEELQRRYYGETAAEYDRMHVEHAEEQEHAIALAAMRGFMAHYRITSLLDVGAGTGRVLRSFKSAPGELKRVLGVEPVAELRAVGHAAGLEPEQLIEGDALNLEFADGEFDLVCAFGILHHIREPERALQEMFRVARRGVFLSDMNNFGCGSAPARALKQILHGLRLWPLVQYVATGGKGYKWSEGDGLHYSYSLFDSVPLIRKYCAEPRVLTTKGFGLNAYRSCSHVALLALKDDVARAE